MLTMMVMMTIIVSIPIYLLLEDRTQRTRLPQKSMVIMEECFSILSLYCILKRKKITKINVAVAIYSTILLSILTSVVVVLLLLLWLL